MLDKVIWSGVKDEGAPKNRLNTGNCNPSMPGRMGAVLMTSSPRCKANLIYWVFGNRASEIIDEGWGGEDQTHSKLLETVC